MARAAVKAKQQQQRANAQPAKAKRSRGRRKHAGGGDPNQKLFFERMRRHAKWAYVALAVLFALTFAGLGVGSGSSGLEGLFSGLNIFGSSGGTSISSAQKEIQKDPTAAKGYRDLATAYEQKGDTGNAISALQSYLGIKKKDANAWAELGGLQLSLAQTYAGQYQSAAAAQQAASPSQTFLPTGTLGTAIGTSKVEQAAADQASGITSNLYQQASTTYGQAVTSYQKVAALRPHDANAQFQVATAAQSAGEYTIAVNALKKYLALNPETTQKAQINKLIKQLETYAKATGK